MDNAIKKSSVNDKKNGIQRRHSNVTRLKSTIIVSK